MEYDTQRLANATDTGDRRQHRRRQTNGDEGSQNEGWCPRRTLTCVRLPSAGTRGRRACA
eukprot:scaffold232296_cov15-Tisochrysis_lutea.AAC.1